MATNTFERVFEIKDPCSLKKLLNVLNDDTPMPPLSLHPFSDAERERSEELLNQCLSRLMR